MNTIHNQSSNEDLWCCRGCLMTDCRLFNIHQYELSEAFSRISGTPVLKDQLPQYLCTYCSTLLFKCTSFKDMCLRTDQCLKLELLKGELTTDHIRRIDRPQQLNLTLTVVQIVDCMETTLTDIKKDSNEVNDTDEPTIDTDIKGEVNIDTDEPIIDIGTKSEVNMDTDEYNLDESNIDDTDEGNLDEANTVDIDCGKMNADTEELVDKNDKVKIKDIHNEIEGILVNKLKTVKTYKRNITTSVREKMESEMKVHGDKVNDKIDKDGAEIDLDTASNEKTEIIISYTDLDYANINEDIYKSDIHVIDEVEAHMDIVDVNTTVKKAVKKIKTCTRKIGTTAKSKDNCDDVDTLERPVKRGRPRKEKKLKLRSPANDNMPVFDFSKFESDCAVRIVTLSKEKQLEEIALRKQSNNYTASRFRCEECGKGFDVEDAYNNHRRRHSPDMAPPKRQKWDKHSMAMAILAIRENKMGFLKASKTFGVPKTTLIRLCQKNKNKAPEELTNAKLGRKATLPAVLEAELAKYVLEMKASGFGLTRKDIKLLAYQLAEKNNLTHNFSKEHQSAGKTWLRLFLRRHPELSLRTGTSIARLKDDEFNRENVNKFYSLLEQAMDKHKYTAANIYNVDETVISVVPSKMPEVLSRKGKKQEASTTSAERGSTVTCVMCMSASGIFIPPMMIFPRKRDHPLLMKGAPPGAIHACYPSGWIQTELFVKWFKHFLLYAKPSETSPVLLILDGHASHTRNIELFDLARKNHVQLLSLPPHSSHKIQPLDRTFMGPLKKYFSEEIRQWIPNKTQTATQYDIAEVFGRAYVRAQRTELAINGFHVTGIYPLDRNVFQNHDFIDDEAT